MVNKAYYLTVDIIIVLLQLSVIICNGFILFLFTRMKNFCQNSSRLLMLLLATSDFLYGGTSLPYTLYLMKSWDAVSINLNPYYVLISSIPLVIQLKINLTLTISIAAERTLALYFPLAFRSLSTKYYAIFCTLFGFSLALSDLTIEFVLTPFKPKPDCAAMGCFLTEMFCCYWGISNMVMGIVVIFLTVLILVKLRALGQKPQPLGIVRSRENRFKQANRSSLGILLTSLVFVTLPSVGAGLVEMSGFSLFKIFGPFYTLGLLCSGVCNSVLYLALNKEIKAMARKCVTGRNLSFMTMTTVKALTKAIR